MKRVTAQDIRNSQQVESPAGVAQAEKDLNDMLEVAGKSPNKTRASMRRETKAAAGGVSPSFQKYDANLKKKLLADEKERVEKAKRDAEDERKREIEEFKRMGSATPSNVVMP